MTRLRTSDLEAALAFLGEANAIDEPDPFPKTLVASLRNLVPCDWAAYCELDRVRRIRILEESDPELVDDVDAELETYWRLRHQHPLCRHEDETRDFRAKKISDFVTTKELRRREIYWEYFHPWGVEYQMSVGLDAPLSHTKVFILDRMGGRDFTERDRAVLNLLRPHLASLYAAAQVRRRARAALALLERTEAALVVLGKRDRLEYATPEAQRLLAAYFRADGATLPEELAAWLPEQRRAQTPEPLKVSRGEVSLLVNLVDGSLFLEERRDAPRLTEREREILDLVAAGKTNAEIAETIWIAPGTVRKHLENIYEKLGVHSRTAAVATLNGEN